MLTKVCLVKAMVFPVLVYGCESWTIRKAECWRTDAFELWCWRRLLRVPWIARRSNHSILKEISPEYSLEGLCWSWSSNTLANWCEELTHWKRPWCWERLRVRGEVGLRGWGGWMVSLTQWTWIWTNSGREWRTRKSSILQPMESQRIRHNLTTGTITTRIYKIRYFIKTIIAWLEIYILTKALSISRDRHKVFNLFHACYLENHIKVR